MRNNEARAVRIYGVTVSLLDGSGSILDDVSDCYMEESIAPPNIDGIRFECKWKRKTCGTFNLVQQVAVDAAASVLPKYGEEKD